MLLRPTSHTPFCSECLFLLQSAVPRTEVGANFSSMQLNGCVEIESTDSRWYPDIYERWQSYIRTTLLFEQWVDWVLFIQLLNWYFFMKTELYSRLTALNNCSVKILNYCLPKTPRASTYSTCWVMWRAPLIWSVCKLKIIF